MVSSDKTFWCGFRTGKLTAALAVFALLACGCGTGVGGQRESAGGQAASAGAEAPIVAPGGEPASVEDHDSGAAAVAAEGCPTAERLREAETQFAQGVELVKGCGERCMKSRDSGERRRRGLSLLREAAIGGYPPAMARYGNTSFGDLMTTGSGPELEGEYVEAIAFLRVTALRERTGEDGFIPNLESVRLQEDGSFSAPLEPPLSGLPEPWVRQGIAEGDRLFDCGRQ